MWGRYLQLGIPPGKVWPEEPWRAPIRYPTLPRSTIPNTPEASCRGHVREVGGGDAVKFGEGCQVGGGSGIVSSVKRMPIALCRPCTAVLVATGHPLGPLRADKPGDRTGEFRRPAGGPLGEACRNPHKNNSCDGGRARECSIAEMMMRARCRWIPRSGQGQTPQAGTRLLRRSRIIEKKKETIHPMAPVAESL